MRSDDEELEDGDEEGDDLPISKGFPIIKDLKELEKL